MTVNKHGNNLHPDLPPCPFCRWSDVGYGSLKLGNGVSITYECAKCGAVALYSSCGPPAFLAWQDGPTSEHGVQPLNEYVGVVRRWRKSVQVVDEDGRRTTDRTDVPPPDYPWLACFVLLPPSDGGERWRRL